MALSFVGGHMIRKTQIVRDTVIVHYKDPNDTLITYYTDGNMDYCLRERKPPYLYYDPILEIREPGPNGIINGPKGGFVNFRRYMWDVGFPDTIIVRFTRDGKFEGYMEAVRQGSIYDQYGNSISPAYVFSSVMGDSWTYDIRGHFVSFGEDKIDNPDREPLPKYNP